MLCGEDIEFEKRVIKAGYKLIYEPKAIVTHKVSKEKLTKRYFLQRSFWQGYSEILISRKSLLEIDRMDLLCLKILAESRKIENIAKILATNDLKEEIDIARSIGRMEGLIYLVEEYERTK